MRHAATRLLLVAALVFCVAVILSGCSAEPESSASDTPLAASFARLKLTAASEHEDLRRQLKLLRAAGHTPNQLALARSNPKHKPGAEALRAALPTAAVSEIRLRLEPLGPAEVWSRDSLSRVAAVRREFDALRVAGRRLLAEPRLRLEYDHRSGLLADTWFIDAVQSYARLELVFGLEQLAQDDSTSIETALETLDYQFRAAERLGVVQSVAARLTAADIRRDALVALAALIAVDPRTERSDLEQLARLVRRQLASWPPDTAAWVGDRAAGLHFYEVVRSGRLASLLSAEEHRRLLDDPAMRQRWDNLAATIDDDELFYLRAIQTIIGACREPYYRSRGALDRLEDELKKLRSSQNYPWIADRFLLQDVRLGRRRQALDRARCEIWLVALQLALGQPRPALEVSPASGLPYRVRRTASGVEVTALNSTGKVELRAFARLLHANSH